MEQMRLGKQGFTVPLMRLCCMGMSDAYRPADETESIAAIHRALQLGINLLDTSDAYGPFTNQELVRASRGLRSTWFISEESKNGRARQPSLYEVTP
jgi:aryl-alcohol dehydrogenase-like predicted oxidoreductase